MKGRLYKTEEGTLALKHWIPGPISWSLHLKVLPLHEDSLAQIDYMEERILNSPEVDFEIIEVQKMSGISKYAKIQF